MAFLSRKGSRTVIAGSGTMIMAARIKNACDTVVPPCCRRCGMGWRKPGMKITVGISRGIRAGKTAGSIMDAGLPESPAKPFVKASGQGLAGIFKGGGSPFFLGGGPDRG